jgi:hypothetical protein
MLRRAQVVASAFAQYYIFAYAIFIGLSILTSGIIVAIFTLNLNMPIRIIFEVVLGLIVATLISAVINRVIYRNGDLAHPVAWTWVSTLLLVINLIKGILSGIIRLVTMFVLSVVQIGIIDSSNFPEGRENMDPVFSSFLQTLRFHHRSGDTGVIGLKRVSNGSPREGGTKKAPAKHSKNMAKLQIKAKGPTSNPPPQKFANAPSKTYSWMALTTIRF